MGRSIPSVSHRIEQKLAQWGKFGRLLSREEQEAFGRLENVIRDRRTAIDEADEADIGVAMLLAAATHLESRACSGRRHSEKGG